MSFKITVVLHFILVVSMFASVSSAEQTLEQFVLEVSQSNNHSGQTAFINHEAMMAMFTGINANKCAVVVVYENGSKKMSHYQSCHDRVSRITTTSPAPLDPVSDQFYAQVLLTTQRRAWETQGRSTSPYQGDHITAFPVGLPKNNCINIKHLVTYDGMRVDMGTRRICT